MSENPLRKIKKPFYPIFCEVHVDIEPWIDETWTLKKNPTLIC